MSIYSEDTYKKVVIENGYQFNDSDDGWITYGFNIVRDSIEGNKATMWSSYNTKDGRFDFSFNRTSGLGGSIRTIISPDNPYELIEEDLKEKCKYYKIVNLGGKDYVTYSCSESLYKGKIGFRIDENGWGLIKHFPNPN